jgi:hypothetical protein
LIPSQQAFANDDAGISIRIAVHLTLWAKDEWSAWGVPFCWFCSIIASNERTTMGALSTCISRAYPTRNDTTLIPCFVGLFFIAVQMLLLMSFVLKIINLPASTTWVGIVYNVSSVFVLPFQLLLQNVALPIPMPIAIEIYTLLAILSYWLLSRLLVRLLKAILHLR